MYTKVRKKTLSLRQERCGFTYDRRLDAFKYAVKDKNAHNEYRKPSHF